MAQQYVSGWATTCIYDYETSFGTGGTAAYPFGHDVKVSVRRNNNMERLFGVGQRNAQYTITKKFEGDITFEFVPGNWYWLRGVLGAQGAAGGGGPYTHAFTEANIPPSMQVVVGTDLGTNDLYSTYTGVTVKTAKIVMAIDAPVRVTLECMYKTESNTTSARPAFVADSYSEPFTFVHGTITYASQVLGNTYSGQVQNCELTINNNAEFIYGIGNRTAQASTNKTREYNIRINYAVTSIGQSADLYVNFLGDTSTPFIPYEGNITGAALTLNLNNGGSTTAEREMEFVFTAAKTFFNTSSLVFDSNEVLKDDVEGWAESISSATYTDNNNAGIGA